VGAVQKLRCLYRIIAASAYGPNPLFAVREYQNNVAALRLMSASHISLHLLSNPSTYDASIAAHLQNASSVEQ
jgi:hypothetical protein